MEKELKYLREKGIKLTKPRKKVLNVLVKSAEPLSLNDIHESIGSIDFASVYRNMKLFSRIDLVSEIKMGDKKIRYELAENKHCHHIICSSCGKIEKLDVCFLSKIKKITDYEIKDHNMEFIGLCPNCK